MKNASVTVSAAANIALIKYWGKVDLTNNQPATASLSIGLEDLRTTTRIEYASGEADTFEADLSEAAQSRVIKFLDRVREMYGITSHLHIKTYNNFPTGTGLASSASGFAALILGLNGLCNLQLSKKVLSQIARLGSGSAARSVYGGFVEVVPSDNAYALPVIPADDWPLDVVVAITDESPKSLSSSIRAPNKLGYFPGSGLTSTLSGRSERVVRLPTPSTFALSAWTWSPPSTWT